MSFELDHVLVSTSFTPTRHTSGTETFFKVHLSGDLKDPYPGLLQKALRASFTHRVRVDPAPGGSTPHGNWASVNHDIALQLTIFTPDGHEFTSERITPADLHRYRNLRGAPIGPWRYTLSGESQHFVLDEDQLLTNAQGSFSIAVRETVRNESASPLIDAALSSAGQVFEFDLFRVGTLVAQLANVAPADWRGTLNLVDPDGTIVTSTGQPTLSFAVDLRTLAKSRDAAGNVRRWRLQVRPQGGVIVSTGVPRVVATVLGTSRITFDTLQSRIDRLLGPNGAAVKLYGENVGGQALARLVITDVVTAESLDMHGLLDKRLRQVKQDPGIDTEDLDIQAGVVYTLARRSEKLAYDTRLDVSSLKVESIKLTVGPGVRLGGVPALRLLVVVRGEVRIKVGPVTIATAKLRDGQFELEVGMSLDPGGTPRVVAWVPDRPFDIDLRWEVVLGLGAVASALVAAGAVVAAEYFEHEINESIVAGVRDLFSAPVIAPRMLMTMFGAHFAYRSIRLEGGAALFDYVAPLEPDPHHRQGYAGAIGRAILEMGPTGPLFRPLTLGNTWAADNLLSKIDHIVVVMMENRSYDHVLGYRAQGPAADGADGLTTATLEAIQAANAGQAVRKLSLAGFAANAVNLKTRIPRGVGHDFADVREQLAQNAPGAGGGLINHPKGFVENFARRLAQNPLGLVPTDVLGYYEASDLPFHAYLTKHYAYCDRYFCSHPGPTLPNRMYALTGDLQYDRRGVPIVENNDGDNFLLSRAATIYDLLTRLGVSWRVYESEPSVAMLRMFARYATNNIDIVPRSRLEEDVATGRLPSFVAIEPAMHHHPQNDDHPDADMYRGQKFLKDVYDTLRSNPAVWQKTLLLITYDEHGGLYDHVVPSLADVLSPPSVGNAPPTSGATNAAHVGPMLRRPPGDEPPDPPDPPGPVDPPTPPPRPDPLPVPSQTREPVMIRYGVRVPTFVVSPWVKAGRGPAFTLDHCSILKTVLARFGGGSQPFLSDRVQASHSFEGFLTEPQPRTNIPPSPAVAELPIDARRVTPSVNTAIITPPLSRKRMRQGPVDYHELSGRLARMLGR